MKTWLVLDANYLCHRAFHSTGDLKLDSGFRTGVLYGFLRDWASLQDQFCTRLVVSCFDSIESKRRGICPTYKGSRSRKFEEADDETRAAMENMRSQITMLRTRVLPRMRQNVWIADGYEADDMIACVVKRILERGDEAVIVSSDQDLFQLLTDGVIIYNPAKKKAMNAGSFEAEWGLKPHLWATVKALAGCSTDDVIGIEGVGEKTAAKWMRGELTKGKIRDRILQESAAVIARNMPLVKLPFHGAEDAVAESLSTLYPTVDDWRFVCNKLGFRSLEAEYA